MSILNNCSRHIVITEVMKATIRFLIIPVLWVFFSCRRPDVAVLNKFYNLTCGKEKNIVWKYNCTVALRCERSLRVHRLSDDDRQLILDWHNYYRNLIALGKDRRGGNGEASNMKVFNYNKDHEITTYCWGIRCLLIPDYCRRILGYEQCGQNRYMQGRITTMDYHSPPKPKLIESSILSWFDEISTVNRKVLTTYQSGLNLENSWDHFTQLMWHETESVGCTILYFKQGITHVEHVLCNYGPTGNILGQPVYQFGAPASECPDDDEANREYPGLCGNLTLLSTNRINVDEEHQHHSQKSLTAVTKVDLFLLFAASFSSPALRILKSFDYI